ncbi:HAMP domain-containing protein [Deinococcus depolymerans]|uniref:HAMP domain-containing protein n=1 Tax=Deinococcus depolymerans TaxID=392408 RepID=A0ABN1C6A2_9DEIO
MKYTVVIRQPVADSMRQVLENQLMERFGLNGEQAQRLSARRSGRLMKPTGRPRAELLLSMFQAVGANVSLEEVREETSLISEPFQGVAPGGRTPGASSFPQTPDETLLAPTNPQPTASQDLADLRASAIWPEVKFADDSAATVPHAEAAGVFPLTPADTADWQNAWQSPPASVLDMGEFTPGLAFTPPSPAAPVDPFATAPGLDPVPAAPAPGGADLGSPFGPGAGTTAVMEPVAVSAPASAPADVWSDFTGALSMPATPAPEATPDVQLRPMDSVVVTPVADLAEVGAQRRSSLGRRMAVGALVPLGLSSALTLGVLALTLPSLQQSLIQRNAQAIAVAVASNIDPTRGYQSIPPQLDALVNNSSVGFVQVELRDGSRYFASQTPAVNNILNARVSDFILESGGRSAFKASLRPADVFAAQAKEMQEMGGTKNDVSRLQQQAADPANQQVTKVNFIVQQVTVVQDGARRSVNIGRAAEDADVLYTVAVGVENSAQESALRRTLALVLLVSLLALGIATYLALRAARLVVRPIEDLVRVADAISMGDLSRPVKAERNDEIGDLAQALERMRLSLDSAMERLRRRKRN